MSLQSRGVTTPCFTSRSLHYWMPSLSELTGISGHWIYVQSVSGVVLCCGCRYRQVPLVGSEQVTQQVALIEDIPHTLIRYRLCITSCRRCSPVFISILRVTEAQLNGITNSVAIETQPDQFWSLSSTPQVSLQLTVFVLTRFA